MLIKPLSADHCEWVAHVHQHYLPTDFTGVPGRKLLQTYYQAIAMCNGACGFVGFLNGTPSGYVCGVWSTSELNRVLLRRFWYKLMIWTPAQIMIRPSLLTGLKKRLQGTDTESDNSDVGYELRPIVVCPEAQGSGLATLLVETLLADARRREFDHVQLYAEVSNARANAFYQKLNFQKSGVIVRSGIEYLRYDRSVQG